MVKNAYKFNFYIGFKLNHLPEPVKDDKAPLLANEQEKPVVQFAAAPVTESSSSQSSSSSDEESNHEAEEVRFIFILLVWI